MYFVFTANYGELRMIYAQTDACIYLISILSPQDNP